MAPVTADAYEFGPFRLEANEPRLLRDGQDVPLPPKAMDLLLVLVCKAGRLVTRETLLEEVWPGTFVEEANITYTISLLRKAIEEGDGNQRYIETVPKRGYRFKSENLRVCSDGSDRIATGPGSSEHQAPARAQAISEGPRPGKTARSTTRLLAALGVTALVLGGFSVTAGLHRRPNEPATFSPTARFDVTLPEDFRLGTFARPTVSPDGRRVAFFASRNGSAQLWIRRLDSAALQALPGTESGFAPFWSPDSRSVGFFADGKLKRVDVDGGPVLTVCDAPREALASEWQSIAQRAAWGNSGVIVFSMGRVYRVSDTGGVAQPVTEFDVAAPRPSTSSWASSPTDDGSYSANGLTRGRSSSRRSIPREIGKS